MVNIQYMSIHRDILAWSIHAESQVVSRSETGPPLLTITKFPHLDGSLFEARQALDSRINAPRFVCIRILTAILHVIITNQLPINYQSITNIFMYIYI
jgi:hypothetical protein